jgi:hypothetical protein
MSAARIIGTHSAVTALCGDHAAACDSKLARRKLQTQQAAKFAQVKNYYDRARDALHDHAARMTKAR